MSNISKKRLTLNAFFNTASHFIRLLVSILMTPFLLYKLGAEIYGLIPLINSCVTYFVLVSGGINSAVGRYVILNIIEKNFDEINRYVNTALYVLLFFVFVSIIPLTLVTIYLPVIINLPLGHENEARFVFFILSANMLVGIVSGPLCVGFYARQRFELSKLVEIAGQFVQVLLIIASFVYIEPKITYLAISIFLVSVISSLVKIYISMNLIPTLNISYKWFDRSKIKMLCSYSSWVLVSQVSFMIILNTDYIIINRFLGIAKMAEYSLAARWSEIIRAVFNAAFFVITPLSTHLDVKKEAKNLKYLLFKSIRISMIFALPSCLIIAIFSKGLITVWVGDDYFDAVPVFLVSLLPLPFILSEIPASSILNGMGKVKCLAITALAGSILNLALSIMFVTVFNLGISGVALGTAITLLIRGIIILPYYIKKFIQASLKIYYGQFLRPIICSIPMIMISISIVYNIDIYKWNTLIILSLLCALSFFIPSYFIAFDEEDKEIIKSIILNKFLNRNKHESSENTRDIVKI